MSEIQTHQLIIGNPTTMEEADINEVYPFFNRTKLNNTFQTKINYDHLYNYIKNS